MHRAVVGSAESFTSSSFISSRGMVASSHELPSFHGAKVLSEGGNVIDAAIATSSLLCVTQNNLCGLGGDLFALVKFEGKVFNLNGSGRASENASIGFYKEEKKLKEIPQRGPLAALTVPGIVHAWGELHSKFGSFELKKLLAPAIHYAKNGFPITPNYSGSIRSSIALLGEFEEWKKIFVPDGFVPETGYVLKQRDLATSLEQIATEGTSTFYSGSLSDKIAKGIEKQGGVITARDLKSHLSTWQPPIKTNYRGIDIYETAPNSQAATVLLWMNMLEEFDLRKKFQEDSADLLDILIDTCLKSYQERAKRIADPAYLELKPEFLSKEYARELLASRLDVFAFQGNTRGESGDTTYFAVGNDGGDCVSIIQSNYMGFGSGLIPEGTGFVLQNRGCYFTLDEKHHNSLRPGKRTFHTLCASLGERENGNTLFSLGSMGGDIQSQIHVQLMTKILDYNIDPQKAIDSPRWIIPFSIYEEPSIAYFEPGISETIPQAKDIVKRNKLTFEKLDSFSSLTGHAQAILFGEGYLKGAADRRGDGVAIGF
jgi:gamma-glutamyltranspeptidase/glutathione hydrolase